MLTPAAFAHEPRGPCRPIPRFRCSLRARIAAGAGVSVTEVNQLMKQFNETKKMMKKMMPSVDELSGKKGKKGKRRRRIPGMPGGMSMADIKKVQAMLEQGDK